MMVMKTPTYLKQVKTVLNTQYRHPARMSKIQVRLTRLNNYTLLSRYSQWVGAITSGKLPQSCYLLMSVQSVLIAGVRQ